jgi:hypothetical protein
MAGTNGAPDSNFVTHFLMLTTHSAYNQHARRRHILIVELLHRTFDCARQFLDAYALPLDGTPTYANISDAVRLLPTITARSIAVPHGLTVNDR